MKKNWKAITGVMLVFVLGFLSGALVTNRVCMHRFESFERGGPQMVDSIVKHLSQTPAGCALCNRESQSARATACGPCTDLGTSFEEAVDGRFLPPRPGRTDDNPG